MELARDKIVDLRDKLIQHVEEQHSLSSNNVETLAYALTVIDHLTREIEDNQESFQLVILQYLTDILTAAENITTGSSYTFAAPLSVTANEVSLPAASNTTSGYLTSTDWSLFNSKASLPIGIDSVTGLQTALDGKSSTAHNHDAAYAALNHTQAISTITGLQTALDGKASSTHTHAIGDVTNLQTNLTNLWDQMGTKASSADASFTGTFTVTQASAAAALFLNGAVNVNGTRGIELSQHTGNTTAFIDFHSSATYTDYDSRIVSTSGTGTAENGTLSFLAGAIRLQAPAGQAQLINGPSNASNDLSIATTAWARANLIPQNGSSQNLNGPFTVSLSTGSQYLVELGAATNLAYIDFHSGATLVDYDARIISSGGNGTSGNGGLTLLGAAVLINTPADGFTLQNAPSSNANNTTVPTTAWVRTYGSGLLTANNSITAKRTTTVISSNATLNSTHLGQKIIVTAAADLTIPSTLGVQGDEIDVLSVTTGTVRIVQGASASVKWQDGTTTQTGTRTLKGDGAAVSIIFNAAGNAYLIGNVS